MKADTALLDDARKMKGDALAKIFDLYAPALYNYALRFCNDTLTADQIVGDVFAKLLDHLSSGHGPNENLRSYLFETTYHLLIDDARYSHRKAPLETIDLSRNDGYSAYMRIENHILLKSIIQSIQCNLTDYQRHVIILRYMEGFSLRETAAILGKSINVVKAAQHHAIMTLRKTVDDPAAI